MHLRLCFGRAVFLLLTFPENRGARLRISGGCPARGEPEALIDHCSSIACRAQPCQRCSPVLQALIIFQYASTALLRQSRFLLLTSPENRGARLRISGGCPVRGEPEALKNFAQASRAKTKSMGLRLFCKLFVNPIDKAGGQEYIFSSRADGVLKTKRAAPQEVCKTMNENIYIINSRLCRRRARSC